MAQKIQMYRPYFSAAEISLMFKSVESAFASSPQSAELSALYKKLRMIHFRIGNDMIAPAIERKETVEESLGIVKKDSGIVSETRARLDSLAARLDSLTEEEKEEGKKLELIEYGMEMGIFS